MRSYARALELDVPIKVQTVGALWIAVERNGDDAHWATTRQVGELLAGLRPNKVLKRLLTCERAGLVVREDPQTTPAQWGVTEAGADAVMAFLRSKR